ncbi:uncharacterized protein [Amphiura filiformis]|uniref:uncharacterized protein n=1 Tax=Amphiura filiformis TaxID=82378 RepID=UPI003B212449
MTEKSKPMTEEELEELFEEVKLKTGSCLEYLKSCDEYLTQEALDAITFIARMFIFLGKNENGKKICSRMVGFMLEQEQGLAQLMVNIVKSTGKITHEFRYYITSTLSATSRFPSELKQQVRVELCKSGIIRYLVKELDSYDPNTKDPKQRILIISTLYDLANLRLIPNVIPIYRTTNAVDVLMKFTDGDNDMTTIYSLQVLAYIVNERESERLAASRKCIATLLDIVQKSARSDDRKYLFVIKIDDEHEKDFGTVLLTQARCINDLASNDANKDAIVQHGGVPILTVILRPEYTDAEKGAVVEALWKLSFLEDNLNAILTHLTFTDTQALEELKKMRSEGSPKLRDACQGLLHQLGLVDIHEEPPVEQQTEPTASASPSSSSVRPRDPPPSYQETMDAPHVMISYQWEHQERAKKVKDMLQAKGYHVWMDVDKMEGNLLVSMANAVEKAAAVLVCFSRSYKSSVNCQGEAIYAREQQKPIIPVKIEDYKPDGWLGFLIAGKKYIRAYDDNVLDTDMRDLLRELGNKGRAV